MKIVIVLWDNIADADEFPPDFDVVVVDDPIIYLADVIFPFFW